MVLKVSNKQSNISNWREVILFLHKAESKDLADIFSWSLSGRFIVMERLTPIAPNESMGEYVYPDYLTDRKNANYGRDSTGKIKAIDYSLFKFPETLPINFP